MHGEATNSEPDKVDRIDLILQELDSLPTLGAVAVRLLELTADDEADASEVIDLVASDPALASKVLALCRCHERGRAGNVTTVDRAVLMLGFEAVRCAVLSVQVFDVIDRLGSPGGEIRVREPLFDREAFWLHSLAVAVASEQIASAGTLTRDIKPSEAFMAGLLHDIGQLILHVLLPESFDQVCRVAETYSASLDRACRQIIGLDTHTPGKRLAEHWGLPQSLIDVIWLNGQPLEALPHVAHRTLIALVSLADAMVRNRYISASAHLSAGEDLRTLCIPIGLAPEALEEIAAGLHDRVSVRAAALGMSETHEPGVLLRSICRANASLARANAGMRQRERAAARQSVTLEAIAAFHDTQPGGASMIDELTRVAESAGRVMGTRTAAAMFQSPEGHGWRLVRFGPTGRPYGSRIAETSVNAIPFESLLHDIRGAASVVSLMPWLEEYLGHEYRLDELQMIPIPLARGPGSTILILENPNRAAEAPGPASVLVRCWQASLAAGAQHDSAGHLTEQLAESNRDLIDTREELARSRTLGTLGEVAAGAAHEMNNPLTVISGRSQLLVNRLPNPDHRDMALEIMMQANRLSDMITALRSFAEPVEPKRRPVDLADLAVRAVQEHGPREQRQPQVNTVFSQPVALASVDPDLLGAALGELIKNATESKGSRHIELRVQTDPPDGRLKIEVRDDGEGLSQHTLRHAFDPFYSARPAGRQPGLGLARARRFVEAHDGQVTLVNGSAGGAIATIWLTGWRADQAERGGKQEAA